MRFREAGKAALAAAVLAASLSVTATEPASADTPGCASQNEVNHLRVLQSPRTVRRIFDTPGRLVWSNDRTFARKYRTCWNRRLAVLVVYDTDSHLSLRWRIVRR